MPESVLAPHTIVTAPKAPTKATVEAAARASNEDISDWRWVEVPEEDLFGRPHTGVGINFQNYGPGRHFVKEELAGEIERLLKNRLQGDMRILQPNQDKAALAEMAKSGGEVHRGI